jgi:cob(I)alamin adenosyltransferase
MKVYTRRGDRGQTDLFGGERVEKDAPRVEAYGAVDELSAVIGVAAAASEQKDLREESQRIQGELFDLGSHLATPDPAHRAKHGLPAPSAAQVEALEGGIDRLEGELEPLATFVLPGGTPAAAAYHQARTVCRRAERAVVSLARVEDVDPAALRYLNRLSDLLFVMARVENRRAGRADVPWRGRDR